MLKCESKTFLTVVTSAFPCTKDQDMILNELRHSGFFDVFQLCPGSVGGSADQLENAFQWGCFLCAHPERAVGFLRGKFVGEVRVEGFKEWNSLQEMPNL